MVSKQDVMDALDQTEASAAQEANEAAVQKAAAESEIARLNQQVADLQTQLANGNAVTEADMALILSRVRAIDARVKGIIVTPEAPPAPEAPPVNP